MRALAAHMQSVQEEERITIAREMHDELGQALTAAKIDLTLMTENISDKVIEPSALVGEIESIKGILDTTIKKMRSLVTALRPEILDSLGLLAALEWQIEAFRKRTRIDCVADFSIDRIDVEPRSSTAIYRIFQETLTNIARHADARKVTLQVRECDDHLLVKVSDDGIGFSEEETKSAGTFGLLGMRERALVFGGHVEITSAKGEGTTVSIKVPTA